MKPSADYWILDGLDLEGDTWQLGSWYYEDFEEAMEEVWDGMVARTFHPITLMRADNKYLLNQFDILHEFGIDAVVVCWDHGNPAACKCKDSAGA